MLSYFYKYVYSVWVYLRYKHSRWGSISNMCSDHYLKWGDIELRPLTFGGTPIISTIYRFQSIKVLHAQLIFQLQSFPYDPKYIDLYRVDTNLPQ